MENNELIALIFSGIVTLLVCIYYMDKKHSVCCECDEVISHRKQNRYFLEKGGERLALCKKCYNRTNKQASLKAQNCSCCNKSFTTRMKIAELAGEFQSYFLCVKCEKQISKRAESTFLLNQLLSPDFIQKNSSFSDLESMVESSGIQLKTQDDLKLEVWDEFITANTSFSCWHDMKVSAETLMLKKQNDRIIRDMWDQ
ncbi:conserved hypothetical protein [Shewanella halifaxensis HAW-EB4]|uniref:Uncharacterized protein n=1 Tax=Shewanella halifaxensis (strain HAW-EB4) TaxID=458817 RepID=B0TTL5_SHEHH|nr:hypothetical protein [Shewanella halifaxensis]ABZ75358.1 conserved hypothetical protein [Shewanella halifaxensis HAW-EB4]